MSKFIRWWLIAFLAIAVINLFSQVAQGQKVYVSRATMDPKYAGQTFCSDRGIEIHVNVSVDTSRFFNILVHEFTHVRQMVLFGSCERLLEKYRQDTQFRIDIEMEAYCADIAVWRGPTPDERQVAIDQLSSSGWAKQLGSYRNFKRRIERICDAVKNDTQLLDLIKRQAREAANLLLEVENATRKDSSGSLPQPP